MPPGAAAMASDECLEQLGRAQNGYLATTKRALPVIVPVALETDGADLLLRARFDDGAAVALPGSPPGDVVALAVGDPSDEQRWFVVAQGVLWTPPAWGPVGTFRFTPELVTGWRLPTS